MMFTVCLQQYVERVAHIRVEADDPIKAVQIAKNSCDDAIWTDGDDAYAVDVYAVLDADEKNIWSR